MNLGGRGGEPVNLGGRGGESVNLGGRGGLARPGRRETVRGRLGEVHPGEPLALALALLAVQVSSPADLGAVIGQTAGAILALGVAGTVLVALGLGRSLRFGTALLIAAAILVSATRGGERIHLVAPLVLLSAIAALVANGRSSVRVLPMLLGVLGVLLLSIALGRILLNPRASGEGGGTQDAGPADASAGGLMQRIREFLGLDDPTGTFLVDPVEPSPAPTPPADSSPNWWLLLIVVLVVALAAFLLWRFLRRRRGGGTGGAFGPKSDLIDRFERVGASAGRERDPSEGLVDYGETLSQSTDRRPRDAGAAISEALYDPSGGNRGEAEELVQDLEANPPPRPEDPLKPDR